MGNAIEFYRDCYLDGMSTSQCDQATSVIFEVDGPALSSISDLGIAAARKEYSRMGTNKCGS